jgi:hypothetical protein
MLSILFDFFLFSKVFAGKMTEKAAPGGHAAARGA